MPFFRDRLTMSVSGLAMTNATSFKNQLGILSIPEAHFRFNFLRYFKTLISETGSKSKMGEELLG